MLVKYAALLAGLLVVLAFGVRPALRRADPNAVAGGESLGEATARRSGGGSHPVLKPPEPPSSIRRESARRRSLIR